MLRASRLPVDWGALSFNGGMGSWLMGSHLGEVHHSPHVHFLLLQSVPMPLRDGLY